MTGWVVELSGGSDEMRCEATREVDGELLRVSGGGASCEEVARALVEGAAAELERCADQHSVAVAA